MRLKHTAFYVLSAGLLAGCWAKPAPIDEDMNLRKQAVTTAVNYFEYLEQGKIDQAMELSIFPYWLDGKIADATKLRQEFTEEANELSHWKLIRARFYSADDISIFAPRLLEKVNKSGLSPDYFVVLQFGDKDKPEREAEGVVFFMEYQSGQWKIQGLED